MQLRLGTRASSLAQWQANWVAERLRTTGHDVELVFITTRGDRTQRAPDAARGGPTGPFGLFTKELQSALLGHQIDLAVHSLKDLPTDVIPGLAIAAVAQRASPFDVFVSRSAGQLDTLPPGAVVGTGSLRRRSQLLRLRPDLSVVEVRGNVDSRLKKLREGQFDALILAEAGLQRLGLADQITQVLPPESFLPAAGQGALGIETREDDTAILHAVAPLNHPESQTAVLAERALLAALSGGCLAPIGTYCHSQPDGQLRLEGCVLSLDGQTRMSAEATAAANHWQALANKVAGKLLDLGAERLIQQARAARH